MDNTDPRRLAWLRAQAQSLGTPTRPVSETRKRWLRQRALDAGYQPSREQQTAHQRDMVGIAVLAGVVIIGIVAALVVR